MASFTDTVPKFNPYIQQLPVEAMVAVGTHKQKLYEEGVQKIQTQIDNIAGLDVVRDVDKAYLQSKLNQLGNNLRNVASGDFSNFQLVNSVSGMTKQLTRDKGVQNAVNSAAKYRKELTVMEEARKKGESSPSNEYVFNKDTSPWLNSDDINTGFNAKYDKYTNWKKNATEIIKTLTKSEHISDNAFSVDAKGNLVIADATVRTRLAGVPPEQIQQALMVGLTPADFKQMSIDGRYSYANTEPAELKKSIADSYNGDVTAFQNKRTTLENALTTTTSIPEKAKLKEQIASIDKTIGQLRTDYNNVAETIDSGDMEAAKARLYTTRQITGFSKAFSYTETSTTYEGGTPQDNERWKKDAERDLFKFSEKMKQDERFKAIDASFKEREVTIAEKKLKIEEDAAGGAADGGFGFTVPQDELPMFTLAKTVHDTTTGLAEIKQADAEFATGEGKDQAWLDKQREAWKAGGDVDPAVAQHFNNTESKRREINTNLAMIKQIDAEADAKYGTLDKHIPKDTKGLTIPTATGGKFTIQPKEFVQFNDKVNKYVKVSQTAGTREGSGSSYLIFDDKKAEKELTPKEYYLYNLYKKESKGTATANDKIVLAKTREIRKTVNDPYGKVISARNKYTADEVTKRMTIAQGVEYSLPTATAAQKTQAGSKLTSLANIADKQNGGLPNSPEWDSAKARIIANDDGARYNLKVVEGTSAAPAMYELTATGAKGEVVKARLTPEMKQRAFGDMFEPSPEVRMVRPYQERIRKMGGKTTSATPGPTNRSNAYLNKTDFPNASIYGVTGNIITNDGGNSYSVRLNIYDPVTGVWHEDIPYPPSGMVSEAQLGRAMQTLNDGYLYEAITRKKPSSEELNKVKIASKKPR